MTRFFDMETAPFARLAETIMGSISGVKPTATDRAKRKASNQFPFVKPFTSKTIGTITSMKRINTQETELTPFSKLVVGALTYSCCAIEPRKVSSPTVITIAVAEPEITLEPMKARLFSSNGLVSVFDTGWANFSTGSLSPVRADWLMKRSFA